MAAFKYLAFDASGQQVAGIVDSESARAARQVLRERGLFPTEVTDLARLRSGPRRRLFRPRLRDSDLCLVTRQWATLLASGLTMEQSLSALIEQAENVVVRDILAGVRAEILAGHSLRMALDQFAEQIPVIYRASVAAGEKSGELSPIMVQLADHLERRQALRQKTLQALLYPIIVASVALLVVIGLMTYVVPSVVSVFQQGKQSLPFLTRAMITLSTLLREWGWLMAVIAVGGGVIARYAFRDEELRRRWHSRLMRAPFVGRYLRTLDSARFASTLSILVGSGVPLLAALEAGREVMILLPMRDAIAHAVGRVREGMGLARALAQAGQFPPLLIHMIASGEATGQLSALLDRAAKLQEADVENRTVVLTTLMEPILLLSMGAVVLLIVLAVMQPIIEINQLIR
jgi:general secretion pathway protein F